MYLPTGGDCWPVYDDVLNVCFLCLLVATTKLPSNMCEYFTNGSA